MNPNLINSFLLASRNKSIWEKMLPTAGRLCFGKKCSEVTDNFFLQSIILLDVDCLIECGANKAEFSSRICNLGKRAIAIEANPITYNDMTKLSVANGVETLNVGLASRSGSLAFYLPRKNKKAGSATFRPKEGVIYDSIQVEVLPLDDIVSRKMTQDQLFALWIDVEGFSLDVLYGAKDTLKEKNCVLIKIEVENYPYFEGQALSEEVNEYLLSFNFIPILTDAEYPGQFNVFYVKKGMIDKLAVPLARCYEEISSIKFGFRELIPLLSKRIIMHLKNAFKWVIIKLLGQHTGHQILTNLGSKYSKDIMGKK